MRLYDTLTRSLVELPLPPGPIRMYVCGSTVYQRVHVGNSRPFVLGMWLRSWLRETGYVVTLVHNITDVDDKVYAEAARLGFGSRELSARATEWFFEDTNDLGLGRPDVEPRATETIPEIVAFIGELVERGRAYEASGDVYFSVAAAPEYGRLSGARLEDMVSQESSALKRDQRDFALWKSQKPHEDAFRATDAGDIEGAIARLVGRYETMGDANVRVLEMSGRVPAIDYLLEVSRAGHFAWIVRTLLSGDADDEQLVHALYAATDVTLWKLLRRDLGQSRAETEAIVLRLVRGVLGDSPAGKGVTP